MKKRLVCSLLLLLTLACSEAHAEKDEAEEKPEDFKVNGYAHIQYERYKYSQDFEEGYKSLFLQTQLQLSGQITPQWRYSAQLQNERDLHYKTDADNDVTLETATLSGPLGSADLTFGRLSYSPLNGMILDSTLNGAQLAFGNKLSGRLTFGKAYDNGPAQTSDDYYGSNWLCDDDSVLGLDLQYQANDKLSLKSGWYQITNNTNNSYYFDDSQKRINAFELALDYRLTPDWLLKGSLGRTNAAAYNRSWMSELRYKEADQSIPHSYSAYLQYRNLQEHGTISTALDNPVASNSYAPYGKECGGKGFELGFSYVPAPNTMLSFSYSDISPVSYPSGIDRTSLRSQYYSAMFEFWF